jgi:hypothetical protein
MNTHDHDDRETTKSLMAEAMDDPAVRRDMEYEWFADGIIVQIEKKMEEMNILRQELAAKMGCTPANVTRLLRKGSNLTLRSIIDLALALDHRFLEPKLVPLAGNPWDVCLVMEMALPNRWRGREGSIPSPQVWHYQTGEVEIEPELTYGRLCEFHGDR